MNFKKNLKAKEIFPRIAFIGAEQNRNLLGLKKNQKFKSIFLRLNKTKPKGSAMLVCIFMAALFATLGVGILLNSRLYFQAQTFREQNRLLSYASENGLKQASHKIISSLPEIYAHLELSEEEYHRLKTKLEVEPLFLIEPMLSEANLEHIDGLSGLSWQVQGIASMTQYHKYGNYQKATFGLTINSTGRVQGFSGRRKEELDLELTFYLGYLPLNQLPAAVEKTESISAISEQIKFQSSDSSNLFKPKLQALPAGFIPEEALPLLSSGLKILNPGRLPNWLLRQILKLEPGNDRIPEGVYLVEDDFGLGGIYVQGNLTELLFGVREGFQMIQFKQKDGVWLLKFNPSRGLTFFFSPDGRREISALPIPVIMINGRIESLGTGQPDDTGFLVFKDDQETPGLLNGVKITVVCSGKIRLSSNLFSEGLEWKEGLPYLKSKQTQLIIWSTGRDFQTLEKEEAGISLVSGIARSRIIEASLVAGAQGFESETGLEEIKIIGNLVGTKMSPSHSLISIFPVASDFSENQDEQSLLVYSEKPLLYPVRIRITAWRRAE